MPKLTIGLLFLVLAAGLPQGGALAAAGPSANPVVPSANPVVEWNRTLLELVRTPGTQPATVHPTRSFALMHAAIYDAVNALEGSHEPYAVSVTRVPRSASPDTAAAAAAHEVLVALYPSAQVTLDRKLEESLAELPDGPDEAAGVALGRATADALLALRTGDGSAATPPLFAFRDAPGEYQPTPPNFPVQPVFTHWAQVTPFALQQADQLRPGPPPELTRAAYAHELYEVQTLGTGSGSRAKPEQALAGRFWNGPIQNYWNEIAQTAALEQRLTTARTARLFALLDLGIADGVIALYDAKYAYRSWRPVTAIRAAASDGNDDTTADPDWLPLVGSTPADPSYPGAHAVVSAVAATVLRSFFERDRFSFEVTSEVLPGVKRSFRRFSEAAQEATLSRIYAGVHFPSDEEVGQRLGSDVAQFALAHLLRPAQRGGGRGRDE